MFMQNRTFAYMVETERRKDELTAAQISCRVHQLLGVRPIKLPAPLPAVLLNSFLLTATLLRKH